MLLRILFTFLVLLGPLTSTYSHAADDNLPSAEQIQASLDQLANSKLSPAEAKQYQNLYESMLDKRNQLRVLREQRDEITRQLRDAPNKTLELRHEVQNISPPDSAQLAARYSSYSAADLERMVANKTQQLNDWKSQLTQANADVVSAQTRPERAQADIASNQAKEQLLGNEIKSLQRQSDTRVSQLRQQLKQLELRVLQESDQVLRQQLVGNAVLMDYALAQRELLSRRVDQGEQELILMTKELNEHRRQQSLQAVDAASLGDANQLANPLLQSQIAINQQLSNELLKSTNTTADLTQRNIEIRQQMDKITQIGQALNEQIAVLKGSLLLSKILQQQKRALPDLNLDRKLPDQVADIRLRQFEITQQRESLADTNSYLEQLLADNPNANVTEEVRKELERVASNRRDLLERLNTELNTDLNLAISLQISQEQLRQASAKLRGMLDEQLFWIASSRPLALDWWLSLPTALQAEIMQLPLRQTAVSAADSLRHFPLLLVLSGLLLGLYLHRRPAWKRRLQELDGEVGRFRSDSSWHTPKVLLLTALMVAATPVVLLLFGILLQWSLQPTAHSLSVALKQLAIALFILHWFHRTLRRDGIAERHFRWDLKLVKELRKFTKQVMLVILPMVFLLSLTEENPYSLPDDVLGSSLMLLGCLALSYLIGRIMWRSPPLFKSRVFHLLATLVLTLAPFGLLVMVGLGYFYTALKLGYRFLLSLYLVIAWMIATGIAERALRVAANKLGYQRALAKREATQKDGAEGEVTVDYAQMDVQQINQQSKRLVGLGLVILFSLLFYLVWADLITLFSYLDTVTLWRYSVGSGDTAMEVPISLLDAIGALLVLGLTLVFARNLPGLLEMLILSKLELRQGTAYATKTLLSYSIMTIGVISTLSTLGVSWDKLQWLVAALSVGLGFGLQEIFANFVSGIIILFERPARIGDTVTIGALSGTVSRIRIRATTITDFDRKEIIVPNKTFVTDHLINWSLSDTITRLVLKIGVAYGSDLALVRKLVLQIVADNPRVLKDPEPSFYFLGFGASTLDHELRVHVPELGDRLAVTDQINREIDRLFREHNIEIAFQQVDINLRNSEGLERLVQRLPARSPNGNGNPTPPATPDTPPPAV